MIWYGFAMPSRERKFRVLLSSPSGLDLEREAVAGVIAELNLTWGQYNSSVIELLKWETNVSPGIGSEPQNVINQGLGTNWDIYLGLMHVRFGMPTNKFGSGTEEEFMIAHQLWEANKQSRRILFYFKNAPVHADEIDLIQLQKVREFKKVVVSKGCLYGSFLTVRELEGFLRVNLTKQLVELLADCSNSSNAPLSGAPEIQSTPKEALDLLKRLSDGSKALREVFEELNQLMMGLTLSANDFVPKVIGAIANKDYVSLKHTESELSNDLTYGARKLTSIRRKYSGLSLIFFEDMTKLISLSFAQTPQDDRKVLKQAVEQALSKVEFLRDKCISVTAILDQWKEASNNLNNARTSFQIEMLKFTSAVEEHISQLKDLLGLL